MTLCNFCKKNFLNPNIRVALDLEKICRGKIQQVKREYYFCCNDCLEEFIKNNLLRGIRKELK